MSELRELYQSVILDHGRSPRNFGRLDASTADACGHNPLCGDEVHVFLAMDGDTIQRAGFTGHGCAISTASASLLTEIVQGCTRQEATRIAHEFQRAVRGTEPQIDLGKLEVLLGVREYPTRAKCATLAWHALLAALESPGQTVTTEVD